MNAVFSWIKNNPVRAMAIVTAVMGAFATVLPAVVITGATTIIGAVLGVGVHSIVQPVTTATAQITTAATQAATQTVQALDQTVVGTVGEVTQAGQSVINNTVDQVLGGILGSKK